MLMLAMDTATGVVSVALHDGSRVLAQEDVARPQAHAEHLAPAIETVLARAGRRPQEVTQVAAGTGPGPFTGLRVGLVTAATFAYAIDAPVGGVCSLDAIAHQVWLEGLAGPRLLVTGDARRKEVYWAPYRLDESGAHAEAEPAVGKAADLPPELLEWPVAGRGPLLYPTAFGGDPQSGQPAPLALPVLDVSAGALAHLAITRLARGAALDSTQPLYLRRPDAQPQAERKPVSQAGAGAAPGPSA
ncbi:tRNA threonylcarbamoyl adenosine modification protein YeaZ [Kineosphaera limosa]|nr:tRNA threonylcarbamoyl adenosine modification protein YeaZ [Kineosphaera limosa]